jgi:hypothetical protein
MNEWMDATCRRNIDRPLEMWTAQHPRRRSKRGMVYTLTLLMAVQYLLGIALIFIFFHADKIVAL